MITFRTTALSGVLAAAVLALPAQDVAPLIREDPSARISVSRNAERESSATGGELTREREAAEPDPSTVIVAVVNNHTITRAQLDQRVAARLGFAPGQIPDEADTRTASMVENLLGSGVGSRGDLTIVDMHQLDQYNSAVREEEGRIVGEWMDQMMLADEARRHGFLISEDEFQDRLREVKAEFNLQHKSVANFLTAMGLTEQELEMFIYDALLVERLLEKFVQLNYTTADLFTAWERNPELYVTPAQYRVAHFTISLLGDESERFREDLEDDAENIRKRLRGGEDPQKLFNEVNDMEYGIFGSVMTWSVTSPSIPQAIISALRELEPGEVSDVMPAYIRSGGKIIPEAFHVVKLLEVTPQKGNTFEEALPRIREIVQEAARMEVIRMVREARTHRRMSNLGGLPPDKLQDAASFGRTQPPVDLRMPR